MRKRVWGAVVVAMGAFVFAQEDAELQARVKQLQKYVSIGSISQADFRDKETI